MNTPTAPSGAALTEVRAMALWLAAHNIPVLPLIPSGKTPATRGGFKDATTNPTQITQWWTSKPYNVGISTGPAQLVVIDLDTPNHNNNDNNDHRSTAIGGAAVLPPEWANEPGITDGADVFACLADRAGQPVPWDTRTVRTPSGGTHLYFLAPHALPSTCGRLGPMIDTRAMGGYVVAPPSRTPTGEYVTVHQTPPAPLPHWLVAALTPAPPTAASLYPGTRATTRKAALAPRRPVTDSYVYAAFTAEVDAVLSARPGTRNATLNRAAYNLGQFVAAGRLNTSMVTEALTIAAEYTGLSPTETARTITSGLDAAAQKPRHDF